MGSDLRIGIPIHFKQELRILIKKHHNTETMAITKLVRTALDRAVHKESIDTKFVHFFKGLVVVLWSSIKVCTNICIF